MGVRLSCFGGHCMVFGAWESDVGETHWIEGRCFCFSRRVAEETQKTGAKGAAEHCGGAATAPGWQLGEDWAGGGQSVQARMKTSGHPSAVPAANPGLHPPGNYAGPAETICRKQSDRLAQPRWAAAAWSVPGFPDVAALFR